MLLFDFLFYSVSKFYSDYNEKGAESTGAAVVGAFQAFNVVTILFALCLVEESKVYINKVVLIAIVLVFQVTTYVRYILREQHGLMAVEKKWFEKSERSRNRTRVLLFIYGVGSVALGTGLAIYIGTKQF